MAKADFYDILGVTRDCDTGELKSAFRKQAMRYHPDKNPGDASAEAKFKEIGEAYEALKDPQKRAAYDRFGHAAFENGGGGSPQPMMRMAMDSAESIPVAAGQITITANVTIDYALTE